MPRKYKERKCPICGDLGERADTVCNTCMRYSRMGRRYEKSITAYLEDAESARQIVDVYDAWRFGKMGGSSFQLNYKGLVMELLHLASAVVTPGSRYGNDSPTVAWNDPDVAISRRSRASTSQHYSPICRAILSLAQTAALDEILQWVHDAMELQYKEGVSRGRSILRSLAEAGVDELNRTVISKK